MGKNKITKGLRGLVLGQKKKLPHLGVRGLSDHLKSVYQVNLSKSAVHKILQSKGIDQKLGRKNGVLKYQAKTIDDCGIILLRCIDSQVGLFDHLSQELRIYFPKMSRELLKKIIIMASFSSLLKSKISESVKKQGFLRLARLDRFPSRKFDYFNKGLSKHNPSIGLKSIKDNLKLVSTIKFYFQNGYRGYCDAKMSTFWDGPCKLENLFTSLYAAGQRVDRMLRSKLIIIGYTKSFDYLSSLVFNFFKGINSGLKKIQFLDEEGKILKESVVEAKTRLLIGYCPKIISKGMTLLEKQRRFRRFSWEEIGEFWSVNILTSFLQKTVKQEVILNNVLIKRKRTMLPIWGFIANFNVDKGISLKRVLKMYLYLWPSIDKDFFKDMEDMEKALLASKIKRNEYLSKMLPQNIEFSKVSDFARIAQILSVIFKEIIAGWEPKGKSGNFTIGKDYINIALKKTPKEVKNSFNKACLYVDNKRVFLI